MKHTILFSFFALFVFATMGQNSQYDRNKPVPVEKVLFGTIESVRNITRQEIVEDKNNGWRTFGGALLGGVIGSQFGSGSGQDVATILGAFLGGSIAHNRKKESRQIITQLVELMIETEDGERYMVIQDLDATMIFHRNDQIRLIYLATGSVRVDKQM
jgi:outer membrane lipoprotein SlyB